MWFHSYEVPRAVGFTGTESRGQGLEAGREAGGGRADGSGRWGLLPHGSGASVWEDEKGLEVDDGDGCTTVGPSLRSLNCTLRNS